MELDYIWSIPTLTYEQGIGGPTRPTDVSSKSENVPPAQVSVRPYPWPIGALKITIKYQFDRKRQYWKLVKQNKKKKKKKKKKNLKKKKKKKKKKKSSTW